MADARTIRRAYEAAKAKAFEDSDGSWSWRPSAFTAFRLGYIAAERKNAKKEARNVR